MLDDPTINEIARRVGKSAAQVVLRWHVERGDIVFPKSVTPERIKENIDIFDFELSGEDVAAISALDKDERTGPDPDTFDYIPSCDGLVQQVDAAAVACVACDGTLRRRDGCGVDSHDSSTIAHPATRERSRRCP